MNTKIDKKILIVEDEKDLLSFLSDKFLESGFSVLSSQDGESGLLLAENEDPDIIIADVLIPKLNGIDMIKKIREKGINSPVVFLTNFGDADHVSKAIEINNCDYIVKSDVQVDDIIKIVKSKLSIK